MTEFNLKSILGKTYDQSFFKNAGDFSKKLDEEGILIFNSFINQNGLNLLKEEAANLKSGSYQSQSKYNVYVSEYDDNFSKNSPRNRLMMTTKKCVPADLIPNDSILKIIYSSEVIKSFYCKLLNLDNLYPYEDPLSTININYYDIGDSLGWHFDNSDFTITLLIKNCIKGGIYEFFNNMRYKNGKENYKFVEKILDNEVVGTKIDSLEGDLMIFKGNKSIHQVTAVEKGERILVTFNYNIKKGVSLSEKSRETFFGRIN